MEEFEAPIGTSAPRIQLAVQRFGIADGVGQVVGALGEATGQETGCAEGFVWLPVENRPLLLALYLQGIGL
jgi:hypothetical protein